MTDNQSLALTGTDSETAVHQIYYDDEDSYDLTTAIIYGIAEVKGIEPTELKSPVLYECVDTAALEKSLFGLSSNGGRRESSGAVEFIYDVFRIVVRSDGWISIHED